MGCGSFMKTEPVSVLKLIIQMCIHGKYYSCVSERTAAVGSSEETLQQEV